MHFPFEYVLTVVARSGERTRAVYATIEAARDARRDAIRRPETVRVHGYAWLRPTATVGGYDEELEELAWDWRDRF